MSEVKDIAPVSKKETDANVESTASPGEDAEVGKTEEAVEIVKPQHVPDVEHPTNDEVLTKLFGSDYNKHEVVLMICAACIIALNQGFVNGVCMSGLLINKDKNEHLYKIVGNETVVNPRNPSNQMIAGFAGGFTNTAISMLEPDWEKFAYSACIILSYIVGAFIAAMINGHAKPYVIEPKYGPTFLIGFLMMLGAALLTQNDQPSRFVFFLATAAGGLANGIASIYSANLIRCTLTGATTDIAIVVAQMFYGNHKGFARSIVLCLIIFWFWVGGIVSFYLVRQFETATLYFSAVLYLIIGVGITAYVIFEMGVSVFDAVFGTWKWKKVMRKLSNENGELTQELMIEIYDKIDRDINGEIDADELRDGLRLNKVKMTDYEIKILFRAADEDGNGLIDRKEWSDLVKKIL